MFKSKKWLVLLIPLTLLIWGYLSWQVYEGMYPELPPLEKLDESRFRESGITNKDIIPFKEPEFDPFLGTRYVKKKTAPSKTIKTIKKDSLVWPNLKYIGFIKDKNGDRKVAAIQINGSMKTFDKNQTIDSMQLLSATGEYAKMKYKNEIRKIEKK